MLGQLFRVDLQATDFYECFAMEIIVCAHFPKKVHIPKQRLWLSIPLREELDCSLAGLLFAASIRLNANNNRPYYYVLRNSRTYFSENNLFPLRRFAGSASKRRSGSTSSWSTRRMATSSQRYATWERSKSGRPESGSVNSSRRWTTATPEASSIAI